MAVRIARPAFLEQPHYGKSQNYDSCRLLGDAKVFPDLLPGERTFLGQDCKKVELDCRPQSLEKYVAAEDEVKALELPPENDTLDKPCHGQSHRSIP